MNEIIPFFRDAKITDIIDIAFITVFIYFVLVWLKKAKARFIFLGMLTMGIVYFIARRMGLYMTTVALQTFFAVAVVMLVIIFQDDFRHFFENIAIIGVKRRHRTPSAFGRNVDILSSALANLARKKIGALVVVRGLDPLERHLEAGINVDSLISQVLLESIFDRHVPSHDGAVIVDGGRIVKLGCYLPLSTNIKEIGRLGTRHAAGLGIAEKTDAFSLIVSEEEGTICVAEDGRLKHLKDLSHLNAILQDFYNKKFPAKKGAGLTRIVTKNFMEKIIAVLLAVSLWLAFGNRTEIIRRDFVVPIEYRNLAPDKIIKEPKTKEVAVTLSGSEQAYTLLRPRELKISLDMSAIKNGINKFMLTKDLIKNTAGLYVVNIDPSEIDLNAYTILAKTIPVELVTKNKPASGVIIRDKKVEPREVAILVPNTVQAGDIFVKTEPIDLGPIRSTTTVFPKLSVGPEIQFLEGKHPEVKVTIDIEPPEAKDGFKNEKKNE
jgi:diadenylate cyclase